MNKPILAADPADPPFGKATMHLLTLTSTEGNELQVATKFVVFANRAAAEGAAQAWQCLDIVKRGQAKIEVISMAGIASPTNWSVGSGQTVSVGDTVALDIAPGTFALIVGVSDRGLPNVEITEGQNIGKRIQAWPHQILYRKHMTE